MGKVHVGKTFYIGCDAAQDDECPNIPYKRPEIKKTARRENPLNANKRKPVNNLDLIEQITELKQALEEKNKENDELENETKELRHEIEIQKVEVLFVKEEVEDLKKENAELIQKLDIRLTKFTKQEELGLKEKVPNKPRKYNWTDAYMIEIPRMRQTMTVQEILKRNKI